MTNAELLDEMADEVPVQSILRLLDPKFYHQEGLSVDKEWVARYAR